MATLQPSLIFTLVDSFFETKKIEVKQQVQNSIDLAIENVFKQLVIQVKQLLVPQYKPESETVQCSPKDLFANSSNCQQQRNKPMESTRKFFKSRRLSTTSNEMEKTEKQLKQVKIQNQSGTIDMEISYQKPVSEHESCTSGDYRNSEEIDEYEIESIGECRNSTPSRRSGIRSKTHICTFIDCGKVFTSLYNFKRHQRFHVGAKPYLCKWSGCSFASITSTNTIKHIKNHLKHLPTSEGEIDPKTYMEVDNDLLNQDWTSSLDDSLNL
ncbi:hypothetical protein RDWZM_001541 [Blomia tropicalis]|uniref:C2H2-type domain-containing protein n=1 Tax=Blomia tropicalis TaxID=40697 RepID=A0A9Q0RQQ7_BLOTA|nr:hypothetical protein RDWZM_001541 [Blomia tropicalis]